MALEPKVEDLDIDETDLDGLIDRNPGAAAEEDKEEETDDSSKEEEPEKKEDEPKVPSDVEKLANENAELRQLLLEQKRTAARLESKLNRLSRPRVVKTPEKEEEDLDDLDGIPTKTKKKEATAEPDDIEKLEASVKAIHELKDGIFDMQLDTMASTKTYADVAEVCSEGHISTILDAITKQVVESEGLDYHHASLAVEEFIWGKQVSPYKYLYKLIKEYHPDYRQSSKKQDTGSEDSDSKKTKEKVNAPGSIASVPGSPGEGSGWTAAKIDAMDELELTKVPKDIYEQYLAGELK